MVAALCLIAVLPAGAQEVPFNTTIAGDRNLGQLYSWTVNNASGYAGCVYHYTVYDYRFIGRSYNFYSESWGSWFRNDAGTGQQYLAVWVRGWVEGTAWYGWDQERFPIWVWSNRTVQPVPVHMQDIEVGKRGSEKYMPAVIREVENRTSTSERGLLTDERYGWKDAIQHNRMEPGYSNRFDGYILYQVPEMAGPGDIRVVGNFGYYGIPIWHLVNVTIDQESIEKEIIQQNEIMKREREAGRVARLGEYQPQQTRL